MKEFAIINNFKKDKPTVHYEMHTGEAVGIQHFIILPVCF